MLTLIRMSPNRADGNQQKHLLPSFATYREFTPKGTHNTFSNTLNCLDSKIPRKLSHFFNLNDSSLGRHVNAASRKSLEIQAYSVTKLRTLLKRKFV